MEEMDSNPMSKRYLVFKIKDIWEENVLHWIHFQKEKIVWVAQKIKFITMI